MQDSLTPRLAALQELCFEEGVEGSDAEALATLVPEASAAQVVRALQRADLDLAAVRHSLSISLSRSLSLSLSPHMFIFSLFQAHVCFFFVSGHRLYRTAGWSV